MIPLDRCLLVRTFVSPYGERIIEHNTVLDLCDGTRYGNVRYGPAIARQQLALPVVGERVLPVEDQLTLDFLGDTASLAYDAWSRLITTIYQAGDWTVGQQYAVTELHVHVINAPDDEVWVARILGPPSGGVPSAPTAERVMVAGAERYVIRDATLSFVRAGRWIAYARAVTFNAGTWDVWPQAIAFSAAGASSLVRNRPASPHVITMTFPSTYVPGPYLHELSVITSATNDQEVTSADAGAGTTGFTLVADPGTFAPSGNVLRYSPSGLRESNPLVTKLGAGNAFRSSVALAGAFRVNVPAGTFLAGFVIEAVTHLGAIIATYHTPLIYLSGTDAVYGNGRPRLIWWPPAPINADRFRIRLRATDVSGSGTLDMAYLAALYLDTPLSRVTRIEIPANSTACDQITIRPASVAAQTATVTATVFATPANNWLLSATGDLDLTWDVMQGAQRVLGTYGTAWLPNSGGSLMRIEWENTAYPASWMPQ